MKSLKNVCILCLVACYLSGVSSCDTSAGVSVGVQYSNPPWGPPYVQGVRYYYLPDIETYYDLSDQEFIYLDNGQWIFTHTLPGIYSSYDLYNGFVVALSFNVFQPWMHHQYYVYHYPRYYYNNVYRGNNIKNIRGFNENNRKPFIWKQYDRDRINDLRRNDRVDRKPGVIVPPQKTNYYGRDIGRPVRVRPNMKENRMPQRIENPRRDFPGRNNPRRNNPIH